MKQNFLNYINIMAGVTLVAFAINIFFEPHLLVTGGATGIGIMLAEYIPIWLTNLIINVPLLLIALKLRGMVFIRKTLFSTVYLSLALYLTSFIPIDYFRTDLPLASVFGGAISGVGLGIVFKYAATTGGSDLAASIAHYYVKHTSISRLLFIIDSIIIIFGFFEFGAEKAMYSIISVFVSSWVITAVLEGLSFSKAAFIVSDSSDKITEHILTTLERGATALYGKGLYTGTAKNVILCVVSSKEVFKLKELVSEIDKKAFIIVADVREVLGEGFKSND